MYPTELRGELTILREITQDDAERIVKWRSEPAVYAQFFDARPLTMERHMHWYQHSYLPDSTRVDYIVAEAVTGTPAGVAGLKNLGGVPEVSYMIAEMNMRGMGFALDAVRTLAAYARSTGAGILEAHILDTNTASIGLVRKLGFTRDRMVDGERAGSVYVLHL